MNTKLQELTDKIYQEGVEKGKITAEEIVADAQSRAQAIVEEAEKRAEEIKKQAEKQSATLKQNTESELKLFSRQMVDAVKSEIANLLSSKIAEDSVKAATADASFMQKVILKLVEEWGKKQELTIGTKESEELTKYFEKNAKELLNKGVTIEKVNNLKTDFRIVAKKEGYKIEVGEEEFIAYFKDFLRPKLLEILF